MVPSPAEEACWSEGHTPRLPSNQLPPRWVSAHDRPSQVAETVCSPVQEKPMPEPPILKPPPTSLPIPSHWIIPVHQL